MDVGILIIPDGDDALDYYVVLEEQIALRDAVDLPHAAALLVGLIFALNIDYPKKLRYTFEVIQKIFIDLGDPAMYPALFIQAVMMSSQKV
ncbi:hypothetical protein G5714_006506 [Onychostoma macrolepis]|uniref:Uncharacterized protein n=1 Tax=Onychostoma macrolepis TaxID=369639 RepID=A0A7J6D432_9TELE|nr:hypothetical protein G5714_006506 [Onychostoma macrolepis]